MLTSSELSGERRPFMPLFEQHGFRLLERTAKYADSAGLQAYGLYPDQHVFLARGV